MESSSVKLGSSLKVPIVQELAREKSVAIPSRYVRRDGNELIASDPSSLPQIPVIDMRKLFDTDSSELHKLHDACQQWGFFQLINHGVNSTAIENMKSEIQGFFNLPIEEKNKFTQQPDDVEGYGQAFVVSDEQKLDWGDMFFIVTLPTYLQKPHLIPKLPSTFRDAIEAYSGELKGLAMKILKQMAKALNMRVDDIEFDEGLQSMRMNYYPPCPQPQLVTGIYPHSDAVGLTILLQVNEMEGLQIKKDGMWIPVSPLPGAFVINVGNCLEVQLLTTEKLLTFHFDYKIDGPLVLPIVTNGTYRSIEHRATVNSLKERLSIATFLSPNLKGELGPAPSQVTPQSPAKFRKITMADYMKGFFSRKLDGKSYIDLMRV